LQLHTTHVKRQGKAIQGKAQQHHKEKYVLSVIDEKYCSFSLAEGQYTWEGLRFGREKCEKGRSKGEFPSFLSTIIHLFFN
jgi:hypothetical protein